MYFRCNKEYQNEYDCPGWKLQQVYSLNEGLILSGHAYISPSSFHKYLRCPAAASREWLVRKRNDFMGDYVDWYVHGGKDPTTRVLVESMREQESEAASDGTKLHECFSEFLGGRHQKMAEEIIELEGYNYIRETLENDGVSQEFLEDRKLVTSFQKVVANAVAQVEDADWWCSEVWVPLRGFNTWGTADLVFGKNRTLYVYDLKTGRQEVKAEFNEQLLGYAVGALDVLGYESFEKVILGIIGVRWQGGTWERAVNQVKDWKNTVLAPKMKECYSFRPSANPGEHCLYCHAKLFCKEWTDIMLFRHNGGSFETGLLEELDSTTLVDRFMWSKQIERFQNAAKDEIALRFEGFDAIEDERVQYVKPAPIKKYLDEEGAAEYIVDNLEDGGEKYLKRVPRISPEEFERVVGDDTGFVEVKGRRPYVKMA